MTFSTRKKLTHIPGFAVLYSLKPSSIETRCSGKTKFFCSFQIFKKLFFLLLELKNKVICYIFCKFKSLNVTFFYTFADTGNASLHGEFSVLITEQQIIKEKRSNVQLYYMNSQLPHCNESSSLIITGQLSGYKQFKKFPRNFIIKQNY